MSSGPPVVAVLGLGEAGSEIAAGLSAAGAVVRGFDPRVRAGASAVECAGDADACQGAAVVLALTCAHEAEAALTAALPGVDRAAIYADMNTASSGLKAHLARLAAGAGVGFADVALMSPVPGNGLHTPMLASGPAAQRFARVLGQLGATVEVLPGPGWRGCGTEAPAQCLLQRPGRRGHRSAPCRPGRRVRGLAAGGYPPRAGERVSRHRRAAGARKRAACAATCRRDGRRHRTAVPAWRPAARLRCQRTVAAATRGGADIGMSAAAAGLPALSAA